MRTKRLQIYHVTLSGNRKVLFIGSTSFKEALLIAEAKCPAKAQIIGLSRRNYDATIYIKA